MDHFETLAIINMILITIKRIISLIGAFVILYGALCALFRLISRVTKESPQNQAFTMDVIRLDLGRALVLGLEFIVAADIIETTTTPDYYAVGILAILVLIRTFLSYFLNRELETLSQPQRDQLH